jgi:hypothetical protein
MGTDEVEVVRAFCRFVRLKAAATPQPEGTWRSRLEFDVADGVAAGESATPEAVRSMIEAGRVIDKLKQGMTAAAIATPKSPVMISINRGAVGSHLSVSGPGVEPVEVHGIWWPDAAVALYEALVAAGGPVGVDTPPDPVAPVASLGLLDPQDWGRLAQPASKLPCQSPHCSDCCENEAITVTAASRLEHIAAADMAFLDRLRDAGICGASFPSVRRGKVTAHITAYGRGVIDALQSVGMPEPARVDGPRMMRLDEQEANALAGEVATRLREGRSLGDLPECGIAIVTTGSGWRIVKDGEDAAVLVAAGAWEHLRTEIARLLRE